MGRERKTMEISASVSRHNSDQDVLDDSLWDELRERIDLIVREHRYETIYPMVV